MKILIAADSYLPRLGGAEVYAYKLAMFLKKEGHSVSVLTSEPGVWIHDGEEFPVYRTRFSKNPLIFFQSLTLYFKLMQKHDLVHTVYAHKLAFLGGLLAKLLRKKLIITEEGMGILDIPGNSWFYARVHNFYRSISIKLSYRFIASCREFITLAQQYTPRWKKITYQPNSIDTEEFKPHRRDFSLLPFQYNQETLVFCLRRMVPKNGVQFLVECAPYVLKEAPETHFVHIGWGVLEEYLKKRVLELGLEKNFHFLGRIENAMVQKYINLADVVVFPSTAEATSIACLESMSLGKPIIASRVGGYPEMVTNGENGYLVNITDSESSDYNAPMTLPEEKLKALATAILRLVNSKNDRERMGAHSRERALKEFSWDVNIHQIIDWYNTAP